MTIPTLLELAEAGAHFGHHRSLVSPKARKFVFDIRSNVALINLEETQKAIETAQKIITDAQKNNQLILFVGTKRSIRNMVKEAANAIGASFITERWYGGTLTNFESIKENIKRMNDLREFLTSEKAAKLSKKERLTFERKLHRYERFLGGVSKLNKMPELIILASASEDNIAIAEANQLNVPVMAITDTDINPTKIDFPIPANDDAPKAIELILNAIISAPTKANSEKVEEASTDEVSKAVEEKIEKKAVTKKSTKKTTAKKTVVKKAPAKKAEKKEVKKASIKKK
ncbi:30S ribosomal protein S2 [Candidatus Berkelbacteria bacterium]|nr:30S ribosomal protein S2 [Candidatus Berkelbacteria bacterium]